MASGYKLKCTRCEFSTEQERGFPFYVENGKLVGAVSPLLLEEKSVDGYTSTEYCTTCNKSVDVTYFHEPNEGLQIKFSKVLKGMLFGSREPREREHVSTPPPTCPTCKKQGFLASGDVCPKCATGSIEETRLWIA